MADEQFLAAKAVVDVPDEQSSMPMLATPADLTASRPGHAFGLRISGNTSEILAELDLPRTRSRSWCPPASPSQRPRVKPVQATQQPTRLTLRHRRSSFEIGPGDIEVECHPPVAAPWLLPLGDHHAGLDSA